MVDWSRTMAHMQEEDSGITLGTLRIGWRAPLLIAALIAAYHHVTVWTGAVSWLGYREIEVRGAPQWMHSPLSTNQMSDNFGVSVPMPAFGGQEIILRHDLSSSNLSSSGPSRSAPFARVLISCFCPAKNWRHFRIEGKGAGELAMPIHAFGFYTVDISQSAGPSGEKSVGRYRWGVRASRPE